MLAALRHRIAELEGREAEFLAVERELRASLASDAARLRDVQQQLDGAKAFVHTILDTIPDPIFVKDEHHAWIVLNEAFCGFMGHSREELLGKSDYDFFPKEEADVFWRLDDALFTTGETNENEESFTDRAGDVHVISTKKALCLDAGGNRILFGVIRDITARVRAEEALRRAHEDLERRVQERTGALERANAELRESEERFRATFEQAAVGIAHVSLDGAFLRVNPRLCDIVGYSADELLTRRFADITAPEDLTASYSAAGEVVGGARESHSFDKRYVRKDGSLVWAHVTTTLAHDAAGRPMYLITGIEDISARKAAEAARLDAEEALQQSEAQLRQAQKMEAVGRLASGVAHDFNNLLLVITVCTELARKQPAGVSGLHALLDDTLNAAKRAAGLTRQLLAFSRQQVLQPRVLDLNELVADAVTMLRRLIGEDIELRTALAPGAALVRVDPGQFVQVLMNLSVNARDAMPDGGSVLIETRNLDVDEGAGAERHGVRAGSTGSAPSPTRGVEWMRAPGRVSSSLSSRRRRRGRERASGSRRCTESWNRAAARSASTARSARVRRSRSISRERLPGRRRSPRRRRRRRRPRARRPSFSWTMRPRSETRSATSSNRTDTRCSSPIRPRVQWRSPSRAPTGSTRS
ncbi:MAG: PAS domain S-box protein [Deltaproteobacteria bacterium]|nr:PAS domain S-box protein [Deltaproteobacteria bacterium]